MTEKTKSKYLLLLECYSFGNSIKEVSLICNVSECLVGQSFSILKKEYNARNLVHLYKLVKIQKKNEINLLCSFFGMACIACCILFSA